MTQHWQADPRLCRVPNWVPHFALRYLAHTEKGISIRELARNSQVHASTVLRQIRRVETKRDDPLFDEALSELASIVSRVPDGDLQLETTEMQVQSIHPDRRQAAIAQESREILQELSSPGAVLAFAKDMEKAVVVRDDANGQTKRGSVVDRSLAQAMALQDWISCPAPGRISRYRITATGRAELTRQLAEDAETASALVETDRSVERDNPAPSKRMRFSTQENPVAVLARRKGRDGAPFLATDLVAASERLREDFELSQIGPAVTQDWGRFLTAGTSGGAAGGSDSSRPAAAQKRLRAALDALGEGLSEVALRCCCYQEGMVTLEKRLDWPARSGKVVLRIALMKLREHYQSQPAEEHEMIG